MIESIEIKNFRCFEKLIVSDLGRINILVGDNAAGKTSLLEATFFTQASNPEVVLRFRIWRGLGAPEIKMSKSGYESFWRDLFYRADQTRQIEIRTTGTPENARHFKAYYKPNEDIQLALPLSNGGVIQESDTSSITPITIEITAGGEKREFKPELVPGGFSIKSLGFGAPAAFYPSSFAAVIGPSEAATQFSALSTKGDTKKVQKAVSAVFPQITNLSPENYSGVWMLHCNVPGVDVKLPIGLVSSGIHKLITILLGMAATTNGVVMIDELDNGFYYKALPKVWESLQRFSEDFDVQLFVSTHSQECLRALLPTIGKKQDDFRLIRVETKGGKRTARVFGGKGLRAALQTATEVRG